MNDATAAITEPQEMRPQAAGVRLFAFRGLAGAPSAPHTDPAHCWHSDVASRWSRFKLTPFHLSNCTPPPAIFTQVVRRCKRWTPTHLCSPACAHLVASAFLASRSRAEGRCVCVRVPVYVCACVCARARVSTENEDSPLPPPGDFLRLTQDTDHCLPPPPGLPTL